MAEETTGEDEDNISAAEVLSAEGEASFTIRPTMNLTAEHSKRLTF